MQVYPGYTIRKIEDELSWRIIKKMMDCWDPEKTNFYIQKRLEGILKTAHRIEYVTTDKKMSDEQLLNKFSEYGWLS